MIKNNKNTILYIDAMVDEACGQAFYNGVVAALEESPIAKENLELIPIKFNYGDRRFSPRLMEDLAHEHNAKGVILSGSEKNTSESQNAWIKDYLYGLNKMLNTFPDMPVFGICFGHQALACLFGGETSRFKYRVGFETIHASHQAQHHPVMKHFKPNYKMGVSHGDHVVRLPQGFHLVATSEYCDCQGLAHDTRPILSLQAHPEITLEIKNVSTDKKDWVQYNEQDFKNQDGARFLVHVFEWMNGIIR